MDEVLEWVRTNWIKTFIIIFVLFFAPLIIVHILFKWDSGCSYLIADWQSGDVIGYIAGFEASLGTTFLGYVAYKQNDRHNKTQVNAEAANTATPFFVIDAVVAKNCVGNGVAKFETSHYKAKGKQAVVQLKNIGHGLATNVSYVHWFGKMPNPEDNQINASVDIGNTFNVCISVPENNLKAINIKEIEYQNIIGFKYKQKLAFKLVCESKQIDKNEFEEEFFLYIYLLGKQVRVGFEEENQYD